MIRRSSTHIILAFLISEIRQFHRASDYSCTRSKPHFAISPSQFSTTFRGNHYSTLPIQQFLTLPHEPYLPKLFQRLMESSTTLPVASIIPGCILWLTDPYRGRYSGPRAHSESDSDEDPSLREPRTMYGHPVMVLHTMGEDEVVVCLVSGISPLVLLFDSVANTEHSSQRSMDGISKSTTLPIITVSISRSTLKTHHGLRSIPNSAWRG